MRAAFRGGVHVVVRIEGLCGVFGAVSAETAAMTRRAFGYKRHGKLVVYIVRYLCWEWAGRPCGASFDTRIVNALMRRTNIDKWYMNAACRALPVVRLLPSLFFALIWYPSMIVKTCRFMMLFYSLIQRT